MSIDTSTTIRELAVELPGATRVFEQLKIDYCCGGNRTLAEASAAVGLSTDAIRRLLENALPQNGTSGETVDLATVPLAELIDHIVTKHHAFTSQELDRLDVLAEKVCKAHGENHPELLRIAAMLTELAGELRPHMLKEERVLFPYIVELEASSHIGVQPLPPPFGTVRNPIRMMSMEHDAAGGILARIRDESNGFTVPTDGCFSYQTFYHALEALEKDLHQHIHLENNILFPRAVELEASV